MKITMYQLINLYPIFEKIAAPDLSLKTLYKLAKITTEAEKEREFYRKHLLEIMKAHAVYEGDGPKLDENGNFIIKTDEIEAAQTELNELGAIEIELPDYKFTLDELEPIQLSLPEFNTFMIFIKEEE